MGGLIKIALAVGLAWYTGTWLLEKVQVKEGRALAGTEARIVAASR
jgi:hypothetical protein